VKHLIRDCAQCQFRQREPLPRARQAANEKVPFPGPFEVGLTGHLSNPPEPLADLLSFLSSATAHEP
jgi:hypothetical protein